LLFLPPLNRPGKAKSASHPSDPICYAFTGLCKATVSAGIRPLPAHHNRSVMLLIKVADNRCSRQPTRI